MRPGRANLFAMLSASEYICPDFEITGNTMDSIHRTGTAAGRGARPENADRL